MKKTVIVLLSVLIIVTVIAYLYINNLKNLESIADKSNSEYEKYYEQEIPGTTLISIINKAMDNNEKNAVEKQEDGTYKDNEKNSIHITIKFLESEKIINMESIAEKQTENFVKYFSTSNFKCTKIEYHNKTKYLKAMYFEQIN